MERKIMSGQGRTHPCILQRCYAPITPSNTGMAGHALDRTGFVQCHLLHSLRSPLRRRHLAPGCRCLWLRPLQRRPLHPWQEGRALRSQQWRLYELSGQEKEGIYQINIASPRVDCMVDYFNDWDGRPQLYISHLFLFPSLARRLQPLSVQLCLSLAGFVQPCRPLSGYV